MDPKEIGSVLKSARAKKNISLEKIYKDTRIQKHIVHALEGGAAEEALSGAYAVLFLKKYASYLGLDSESLVRDYKYFCKKDAEQKLEPEREARLLEIKRRQALFRHAVFLVSGIFLVLLLLLGARLLYSGIRSLAASPTRAEKKENLVIPKGEKIELKLYATDNVWMEIKEDGKKVFRGTLPRGKTKTLRADQGFSLWLGKTEAVEIEINGKKIPPVAKGVQKNIVITREGISL